MAGLAIAMASRVMAIAAGRQTLTTSDAHDALAPDVAHRADPGSSAAEGHRGAAALFGIGSDDAAFVPPVDGDKAYRVVRHDGEWTARSLLVIVDNFERVASQASETSGLWLEQAPDLHARIARCMVSESRKNSGQ